MVLQLQGAHERLVRALIPELLLSCVRSCKQAVGQRGGVAGCKWLTAVPPACAENGGAPARWGAVDGRGACDGPGAAAASRTEHGRRLSGADRACDQLRCQPGALPWGKVCLCCPHPCFSPITHSDCSCRVLAANQTRSSVDTMLLYSRDTVPLHLSEDTHKHAAVLRGRRRQGPYVIIMSLHLVQLSSIWANVSHKQFRACGLCVSHPYIISRLVNGGSGSRYLAAVSV